MQLHGPALDCISDSDWISTRPHACCDLTSSPNTLACPVLPLPSAPLGSTLKAATLPVLPSGITVLVSPTPASSIRHVAAALA